MSDPTAPSIGYDQFGEWYDDYRRDTLEPAAQLAMTLLQRELDDLLSDRDLARINNIAGRVKSKRRAWRKLQRYEVSSVDQIAHVVDDLVGLRITCTNLRDLEMVQAALDSLPHRPRAKRPLALDPTTERDYVDAPKDSGYRGWHVNLVVLLGRTPVTCELQIRTLLQDSWGELTHEDTYSKAGELPPLVEILSKRMADLLATLDDIAEDLRTELDRIDEAVVAETGGTAQPDADATISGVAADAADLLLDRWRSLDRPVELASLAWALQKEFGAEVSDDWFGHGSFKRFLRHVVPDGEISTGRQAYLLPAAGAEPADAPAEPDDIDAASAAVDDIPDEARRLRRIDRGFPLVDATEWSRIYIVLADAWAEIGARPPTTRMLNQLTRSARDRAAATGEPISRRHLDYVAKAVLADVDEPLPAARIGDAFVESTLQRMADVRIIEPDDAHRRAAVARWLLA
ncbi:MAG: RelA/SpoT domain-containing protein [Ilumatobacter sp.]|nr:RelA/SpoT domain-containing protein [Ilumatobacter sp.]